MSGGNSAVIIAFRAVVERDLRHDIRNELAELFDVRLHLVFVRNLLAQAVVYDTVRFRIQTVRNDWFCLVH